MKIIKLFSSLILLLIVYTANAQTSQRAFSFQGYAVNSEGASLVNENVDVKFTVYPKTGVGFSYEEVQNLTTDVGGVFHATVGSTNPTSFQQMNFTAKGTDFWMRVEVKASSATAYTQISDAKLMAVPYAKYAANGVPVGTIMPFAGEITKLPAGWLFCDGTEYDGTSPEYFQLYNVIKNTWGGTGTAFNVPELRGYFLRGHDNGQGNDPDAATRIALLAGGNAGDNVGSYQTDTTKIHQHHIDVTTANGGNHHHTSTIYKGSLATWDGTNSDMTSPGHVSWTYTTGAAGSHAHNFTGNTENTFEGNETRPVNAYVVYIIKY